MLANIFKLIMSTMAIMVSATLFPLITHMILGFLTYFVMLLMFISMLDNVVFELLVVLNAGHHCAGGIGLKAARMKGKQIEENKVVVVPIHPHVDDKRNAVSNKLFSCCCHVDRLITSLIYGTAVLLSLVLIVDQIESPGQQETS